MEFLLARYLLYFYTTGFYSLSVKINFKKIMDEELFQEKSGNNF